MLRAVLSSFVLTFSLLLAACGGSDGGAAAPAATATASGDANVVKGLVRNGRITASAWRDGEYVRVGRALTDANGDFLLDVSGIRPGEVLRLDLGVNDDPAAPTAMLCDAAACGATPRGEWMPMPDGFGLASYARVGVDGDLQVMPVTPVSTLLVAFAEEVGGGGLSLQAIEVARQRVAALLGLSVDDLLARPGSVTNSFWMGTATPQAVKLALFSAAFAEMAQQQGMGIGEVIAAFTARFNELDGHLMQAGEANSLLDLYSAVYTVLAGGDAAPEWAAEWLAARTSALQYGEISQPSCAPDCGEFDSNALVDALGTDADTLGGDLDRLMAGKGVTRLEDLIAGELQHFGWLLTNDTVALARTALGLAAISAANAVGLPLSPGEGLVLEREGNVLHFDGSLEGMAVDVDITIPPLLEMIQEYRRGDSLVFVIGASGTVQNERLRGGLDGSLRIDATGTDFLPVKRAIDAYVAAAMSGNSAAAEQAQADLLGAVADILRRGEATFTLQGAAGVAQLQWDGEQLAETRRLAVQGEGSLWVDMDGRRGGGIAARGSVAHGSLQLPNGDHFDIDPAQGHFLRFALGADGTAEARFAAHVLGQDATVSGEGRLGTLGALLGNVRDTVASAVETLTLDLETALAGLLADLGNLTLEVSGQAVIPGYGHTYTLTIRDGVLRLYQPDSTVVALEVRIGRRGLLLSAGDQWWLFGLDITAPALRISHSSGAEWTQPIVLPGAPAAPELVADSGAGA